MRRLFPFLLPLLLLVSCTNGTETTDLLYPYDKALPQVLDHGLEDNSVFTITFSETVEVLDLVIGGEEGDTGSLGKTFRIPLPEPLEAGEKTILSMEVRKTNGNTARVSFTLVGINENLPQLLINEVSVKGTTTSPDRVELLAVTAGDTLGMVVTDEVGASPVVLPSLSVEAGDIIVLYWNNTTSRTKETREDDGTTYYVNGKAGATLAGTSGAVMLLEREDGETMDALLYSDSTSTSYSGYGTAKAEAAANKLIGEGSWEGNPVDSSYVTSSRILERLPGAVDNNSADDWFTCAARKSTFGEKNAYTPYEET